MVLPPRDLRRAYRRDRPPQGRFLGVRRDPAHQSGVYQNQGSPASRRTEGSSSPASGERHPRTVRFPPGPPGPCHQTRGEALVDVRSPRPSKGLRRRGGAVVSATSTPRLPSGRYPANSAWGRRGRVPRDVPHLRRPHSGRRAVGRGGGEALQNPLVGVTIFQQGEGVVPPGSGGDGEPVGRGLVNLDLVIGVVGKPAGPQRHPRTGAHRGAVSVSAAPPVVGVPRRKSRIPPAAASAAGEAEPDPRAHRRTGGKVWRASSGPEHHLREVQRGMARLNRTNMTNFPVNLDGGGGAPRVSGARQSAQNPLCANYVAVQVCRGTCPTPLHFEDSYHLLSKIYTS